MTFKKSDPTVVTLYFRSGHGDAESHPRVYHMDDKDQLITVLRENILAAKQRVARNSASTSTHPQPATAMTTAMAALDA
jgi:hypothetical protein